MIKVVLIDDHLAVLKAVVRLLEAEDDLQVVAIGTDGKQALNLVQDHEPDVLITDINMPDMDGIEVLKAVGKLRTRTKVLVMSLFTDYRIITDALKNGARGYISKHSIQHLAPALRTIFGGAAEPYLCPIATAALKSHS